MLWPWIVLGLAVPAAAIVGGGPAAPPEPESAVVFTQRYGFSGRLEGLKNDSRGYYVFAGIRYAEPPVGAMRFQRPVRRYLAGEINATRNCAPCPQVDPRDPSRVVGREDCLCLNVFTPKMPGEEQGSPIIFFIHGGNYRGGSVAPYGGQNFAQKDTILVTAQYRLGSLGFLSTGQRDASGNTGMFDLLAAMAWINDYIEFFGGDKSRLVVMGQGSGGSAASLLSLSPEGKSVTGVVALSGAPLSPGAIKEDPNKHATIISERTGCPREPAESLIRCLRKISAEKIVQIDTEISSEMLDTEAFLNEISGRSGAGVRVEDKADKRGLPPIVHEAPADSLKLKHQKVPILTGVVAAETANAVYGKFNEFLIRKLNTDKEFIKKHLIGGLKNVVDQVKGINTLLTTSIQSIVPLPDYYQSLFDSSMTIVDGLLEVVEATNDALFNFPAYQTVRTWSTAAPAFLYSFEHTGNLTKGSHFLPGLALTQKDPGLVDESKKPKGPAHGDELAYLFEPLDENGNSVARQISQVDARARENFLNLVTKFARQNQEEKNNTNAFKFLPFSSGNEQFLKITDTVTTDKDFRFCEMGLWGNMADRLTGALCKKSIEKILNLPKLLNKPLGALNPLLNNDQLLKNNGLNNLVVNNPLLKNPLGGGNSNGLDNPLGNANSPVVNNLGSGNLLGLNQPNGIFGGGLLSPPKNPNKKPPEVVPMWQNTFNPFGL